MTQLWQPSNPPAPPQPDNGTFYGANRGALTHAATIAANPPAPLPDRVDNNTPVEIRNAFIERYWNEDGPSAAL